MEWWVYLFLAIIAYFIYKGLSNNESTNQNQTSDEFHKRKTGRGANYQNREKESYITSAKRQESSGNYDEASRLYLRAGQVFSAAKMKALKGPQFTTEAVQIVQINSPERAELIIRNLANDFFYRLDQPATSASLLRNFGLNAEAEAVEVAAGISHQQNYQEPIVTSSAPVVEEQAVPVEFTASSIDSMEEPVENDFVAEENTPISTVSEPVDSFPNSMMLASTNQAEKCSVCKREIKSGDSFIYCLNCGKPGHYAHLGEMIKVTGKCPVCKKRLTPTMYDI